ncbi:hypothetical protein EJ05DRAFT_104564 [Pseudovirgaria hyperparasitica]|uniref:LicD/FKTN/FKRP nucleotidyltransferase domain-containing protein n=1 Tax=Pseudovirgaria hyperparasitica TaxID=470096 RepID=A0A6A6VZ50_9PEZI|nr:uncharacterized protein EJ05DRAFT_104564 [Pseudovirgaria hyperparasitica]KAF2755515.1 hypothetical protein EJ05DRAFT_104564 [Pseudovirgaria hyperparasitica]
MKLLQCLSVLASSALLARSVLASPAASPRLPDTKNTQATASKREENQENEKKEDKPSDPRYFHEPGGNMYLNHYDHMMRSYLIFFHEKNLETWIAHGSLLGWWWNGKMLPWDWDIDTQVPDQTLYYLGENYNQTTYQYRAAGEAKIRNYLIDVNPHFREREHGDGANFIDARWIDMDNGLYIDITGLSELDPATKPGVWSCKNFHDYRTADIYPLRDTFFEGVPARIPYAYDKVLLDEYHEKALVVTDFEGHRWDATRREWLRVQDQAVTPRHDGPHLGSKALRRRAAPEQQQQQQQQHSPAEKAT